MASAELVDYYRRRAAEYEAIYAKPERQTDLDVLKWKNSTQMQGARALEVACDLAKEPMRIAQAKPNSYQLRRLADGSPVRVLKNFPAEAELRERLLPHASSMRLEMLQYYWLAQYRLQ